MNPVVRDWTFMSLWINFIGPGMISMDILQKKFEGSVKKEQFYRSKNDFYG